MTAQSPIHSPNQFVPPSDHARVSLLPAYPLGIGELIDRGFRLYRRYFRAFVLMSAVLLLPILLVSDYITGGTANNQLSIYSRIFPDASEDQTAAQSASQGSSNLGDWALISTFVILLADAFTSLGLTTMSIAALRGDSPSLATGFSGARRNFWRMLRLGIVIVPLGLGVLAAAALAVFVLGLLGGQLLGDLSSVVGEVFGQGGQYAGALMAQAFVYFCVLPVALVLVLGPPAYLFLRWSVAWPSMVDNELGARKSLRMSWEMTRGSAWRVAAFFALFAVLTAVIVYIPNFTIQAGLILLLGVGNLSLTSLASIVVGTTIGILWMPMWTICLTLFYFDLQTRERFKNAARDDL